MSYTAASHQGADRVWRERQCKYSFNVLKKSCDVEKEMAVAQSG